MPGLSCGSRRTGQTVLATRLAGCSGRLTGWWRLSASGGFRYHPSWWRVNAGRARGVGLLPVVVSRGRWALSLESTPVGGERRFKVTELGPAAAGELVALSGRAYP